MTGVGILFLGNVIPIVVTKIRECRAKCRKKVRREKYEPEASPHSRLSSIMSLNERPESSNRDGSLSVSDSAPFGEEEIEGNPEEREATFGK